MVSYSLLFIVSMHESGNIKRLGIENSNIFYNSIILDYDLRSNASDNRKPNNKHNTFRSLHDETMTQNKQAEIDFFDRIAPTYNMDADVEEQWAVLSALGIFGHCRGKYILEAGCGTGEFGRLLAHVGSSVIGADISRDMINENKKRTGCMVNYTPYYTDIETLGIFLPDTFDIILCINFLHHFQNRSTVIRNFHCWLKPGGCVYIYEPNGDYPAHKFFTFCRDVVKHTLPFLLKGLSSSNNIEFVKSYSLIGEFINAGFVVDKFKSYDQHSKPDSILSFIRCFITGVINLFPHNSTNHFILVVRKSE